MSVELIIAGCVVGMMMGLTGAGGGVLAVPILAVLAHLKINQAAPIALSSIAIAAGLNTAISLKQGLVRYRAATLLAICGLLFAPVGVWLAHQLPNAVLSILFSGILLWLALQTWENNSRSVEISNGNQKPCVINPNSGRLRWTAPCFRRVSLAGAISGFLSGLIGIGGGFIMVPALQKISALSLKSAVATALMAIALISLGIVAINLQHFTINQEIAVPFIAGTILGILLGKLLNPYIPEKYCHYAFAVLAVVAAALLPAKTLLNL